MDIGTIRQRQSLELDQKILFSNKRIREWYEHFDGEVYVSFSGGKDSTVLLDLVRRLYPNVPAVFVDTGLEYPEIREFVKTIDNVVWLKPKTNFKEVINKYGYPIISKEIALTIEYARKGSLWAIKKLNGEHNYGNHKKYKHLLDFPIKISDKCCYHIKKEPFKRYEKETGKYPIIGTMISEGGQRASAYKRVGCNAFDSKRPISKPISIWTEKDIWEYIKTKDLPYSNIYNMGYNRTGCMFCMFGVHLEKSPNRFQLMKNTHPKQYDYCINKLECGKVLDLINVKYE